MLHHWTRLAQCGKVKEKLFICTSRRRVGEWSLILGLGIRRFEFMIYLLTAIGLSPAGSSTIHIYTQTIHRTTQNWQYIEQHKNFGRVRTVPRLGELYPGICPTTEGKSRKNLSQPGRFTSSGRALCTNWRGAGWVPKPKWTVWRRDYALAPAEDRTIIS